MKKKKAPFVPDPAQVALWPSISGNDINGLGESDVRRPRPVYWHDPASTPHGPLQRWFLARFAADPEIAKARAERQKVLDMPLAPISPERIEQTPAAWSAQVKQAALDVGADLVGITRMRTDWVFEGHEVKQRWIVMFGVAHDYSNLRLAPDSIANAEVVRQYARGNWVAKSVASWIRQRGHDAEAHAGPMAGPMTLIPPALECGFGELGKHGSIINRRFGSNFRLAAVLTDIPLIADKSDTFGVEDYCSRCMACSNNCPPDAIHDKKQTVRGASKWYVDFDKCLPYFNEHAGCAICIAICPWSAPGVASKLLQKLGNSSDHE